MTLLEDEDTARSYVAERFSSADYKRLEIFATMLREANETQNLVSKPSINQIWLRHIADSIQLLDLVPRETSPWLDIGTGAGFPGLALAIIDPSRPYVLVETRNLRTTWLQFVIDTLGLENCSVEKTDVRNLTTFSAGVISARAVAPLEQLIALGARFSTSTTHWVLPKGRSAEQEVETLLIAQRKLFHVEQSMTDGEAGIVVGVGKMEIVR